jgi:spermidine synthase
MRLLLAVCFVVTGAAALAYEILWSRHLQLLFGANAEAVGLVLAVFMSGLGIGGIAFGRLADRARSPLRLYAGLEALIGLFAVFTAPLLAAVAAAYPRLAAELGGGPVAVAATKALLATLVLFPPALLMGGTLPALTRALALARGHAPRVVARLYALNLAGAVLGASVTGFVLVERVGLAGSMRLAAGADLAVALTAWLVAGRFTGKPGLGEDAAVESVTPASALGRLPRVAFLAGLFVSGATFMLYEVVFTRLFGVTFGVSSYSFALVLSLCLLGLGLGGFRAAALVRRGPPGLDAFGRCQILTSLLALLAVAAVPLVPWALVSMRQISDVGFTATLAVKAGLAALLLLPLAAAAGAGMPLLLAFATDRPGGVGASVGRATLVNTAGTLAGSLLTGFVLLTAAGSETTLRLGAGASLAAGLLAIAGAGVRLAGATRVGAILAGLLLVAVPRWPDWVFLRSDTLPRLAPADTRLELAQRRTSANRERLFFEEGRNATLAVLQSWRTRSFVSNGHPEASDALDMATQVGIAIVPLLAHPAPRDVFVVGFASGVTAGVAARAPGVERVEVADLEAAAFRAGAFFAHVNGGVLTNPNVRLVADDARSHLAALSPRRFDVIISEPSNLWRAGVSNLFTEEFYVSARRVLKPGGVFAQWVQLYGLRWDTLRVVFATIARVFPDVEVWWVDGADIVLLASETPVVARRERVESALAGVFRPESARILRFDEPSDFFSRLLLDRAGLEAAVGGASRLNTDDRPSIEFDAPRDLFEPDEDNASRLLEMKIGRGLLAAPVAGRALTDGEAWAGIAGLYEAGGRPGLARAALERAREEAPSPSRDLRIARYALLESDLPGAGIALARARAGGARRDEAAEAEGRLRAAEGRVADALEVLKNARPDGSVGLLRLELLVVEHRVEDALDQAERLLAAARMGGEIGALEVSRIVEEIAEMATTGANAARARALVAGKPPSSAGFPRIPRLLALAALDVAGGRPEEALLECEQAEALSALDLGLLKTKAAALRALGRAKEAARVESEAARLAAALPPR